MWCHFMAKKGMVDAEFMKTVDFYCIEYEAGRLDYAEFEQFILKPLGQLTQPEVAVLVAEYLQALTPYFRSYMLKRLEDHRSRGDEILLATASNNILAEPVAKWLGISNLICTWVEVKSGVPTGRLAAVAPFREGKANSVKAWIAGHPFTLAESWGYSDSHNDLPILNLVAHPVAVTPDATLRQYAEQHGWPIIDKPAASGALADH
jgi:HAD superfamily hydrolase (TIGR01490 family)